MRQAARPIFWGLAVGGVQAAIPLLFWWLTPLTVQSVLLAAIAAVYVGFAVADGRPRVIAVESLVAIAFIVTAMVAVSGLIWMLAAGYAAHALKDYWQARSQYVANTRWWPPFCAAIDALVAVVLVVMAVSGSA